MNTSIEALLDLQVIDKKRLALRKVREEHAVVIENAAKAAVTAANAAHSASGEVDKLGALVRQYTADVARCDNTITDLRSQQMNAKTNKDYMAIMNNIEAAKLEKANREQSVKELQAKIDALKSKAQTAEQNAAQLRSQAEALKARHQEALQPTAEETDLQQRYDSIRGTLDPAFLEAYERLVKANHKMPLMRIDPKNRSTAYGSVVSHNVIEQIRMGKLVIDRGTNAILYVDER